VAVPDVRHDVFFTEWMRLGQELVKDAAQCEHVAGVRHLWRLQLISLYLIRVDHLQHLRCQVMQRADGFRVKRNAPFAILRTGEVGHFESNPSIDVADEKVVRFEVSVDQIVRMNVLHSSGHLVQALLFWRQIIFIFPGYGIGKCANTQLENQVPAFSSFILRNKFMKIEKP